MPSLVNRLVVRELTHELEDAQGMLFLSFGGLTVKESESLRSKLAAKGVKVRMLRNALARRVLADRGFELGTDVLSGNTALAWGSAEAAIHAAKIATDAETKKTGKIKIRAGVIDGQLLSDKDAASLANVPDKNTLRAMILGCISAPARGLVTTLNGLPGGLARVINAHAETMPKPPDAEPAAPAGSAEAATPGATA
jgi:large subunit ribosomal protein L10